MGEGCGFSFDLLRVRAIIEAWGQRGSAFGSPVMRLPRACDSRKVTGRVSGIATTGEQDCDLRLLLSKLFRQCRLPKERGIGLCEPGKETTWMLRALH
jgi:hypothetical protein